MFHNFIFLPARQKTNTAGQWLFNYSLVRHINGQHLTSGFMLSGPDGMRLSSLVQIQSAYPARLASLRRFM